jgi:8-oxo-dGTP pyrophosphatase MutT (NUDIX family)
MLNRCHGILPEQAQKILGNQLSPEISIAHWVAAIRELFEEAGILLAVTQAGKRPDLSQKEVNLRLDHKRQALVRGNLDFSSLLESEELYCDTGRATFFYHRVTPEIYSIRFDTRFYLAELPSGQTPLSSSEEVVDSIWVTPKQALESCDRNRFPLIPPTTTSLEILAKFDSWNDLCSEYRLRK